MTLGLRLTLAHAGDASSADISDCGRYRYRLVRRWGGRHTATFVMLNPSTADATEDDPTIRRCIGFAKREGCGALEVLNLFALRATDPRALASDPDPVGVLNDSYLRAVTPGLLIVAWGAEAFATQRAAAVARILRPFGPQCLGVTKSGAPRHPLYLRADAPLVPWGKP